MSSADRVDFARSAKWLRTWPRQYGFAAVLVAAAALARYNLGLWFGFSEPFTVFYLPIMAIAFLAGTKPALCATGLSAAVAEYFFISPAQFLRHQRHK